LVVIIPKAGQKRNVTSGGAAQEIGGVVVAAPKERPARSRRLGRIVREGGCGAFYDRFLPNNTTQSELGYKHVWIFQDPRLIFGKIQQNPTSQHPHIEKSGTNIMLRSKAIPEILDRICDTNNNHASSSSSYIDAALFVNSDGELLGTNTAYNEPEELATLLADIALDYQYLGDEYVNAMLSEDDPYNDPYNDHDADGGADDDVDGGGDHPGGDGPLPLSSQLKFVLIEMDAGLVGIAACPGIECFVIAIAKNNNSTTTPRGLLTARLQELSSYLQESLVPLIEQGS
jgi:hypothetical protein